MALGTAPNKIGTTRYGSTRVPQYGYGETDPTLGGLTQEQHDQLLGIGSGTIPYSGGQTINWNFNNPPPGGGAPTQPGAPWVIPPSFSPDYWDAPPTSGGGGSSGPGWSINADPGYLAAQDAERSGMAQLEASLKAARERAVIEFGDPALAGLAGFGLDPQAADFAKQNYLSGNAAMARLDKEKEDKRKAIINTLAGRGILFSGETGYQETEAGSQYGRNVYDARNKVLDYLRGLDQTMIDRKAQLRQATIAAMQNAQMMALQGGYYNPGGGGGGTTGGGGGGGGNNYQWNPGWEQNLAAAGLSQGQVANAISSTLQQRGWGTYGAGEQPRVMKEGQVFTDESGRRYVEVKVGTPQGTSTERVYVG